MFLEVVCCRGIRKHLSVRTIPLPHLQLLPHLRDNHEAPSSQPLLLRHHPLSLYLRPPPVMYVHWLFGCFTPLSIIFQLYHCFLGKLPALLIHLSWHQTVSRNANLATLSEHDWNEFGTLYERNGILRSERNNHNDCKIQSFAHWTVATTIR